MWSGCHGFFGSEFVVHLQWIFLWIFCAFLTGTAEPQFTTNPSSHNENNRHDDWGRLNQGAGVVGIPMGRCP